MIEDIISNSGKISIVGAGPGDPDLLTVLAVKYLQEADVVVADKLIPLEITNLRRSNSTLFISNKIRGNAEKGQEEINNIVLNAAKAGKNVVRLKGGDPFVFGRGGEEVLLYRNHGFNPMIIPGISSCISGPTAAMIPVTHRGVANRFMVCTAHGKDNNIPELPLFLPNCSFIFMMGVKQIDTLTKKLINNCNFPSSLHVTIIQEAWQTNQQIVYGTLFTITQIANEANIKSPAVIIIGNVAEYGFLDN
jgi:uroporphyrin-III C-methyltransferase